MCLEGERQASRDENLKADRKLGNEVHKQGDIQETQATRLASAGIEQQGDEHGDTSLKLDKDVGEDIELDADIQAGLDLDQDGDNKLHDGQHDGSARLDVRYRHHVGVDLGLQVDPELDDQVGDHL